MAYAILGTKFRAWNNDGTPLAFGKVYTYATGTNTPKTTYTAEGAETANANPVILNSAGYADICLDGSYKIVIKDADEVEIETTDPVTAGGGEEWVDCMTATYLSPTSFKISGNVTDRFDVGRRVRIDSNTTSYAYASIISSSYGASETTVVVGSSSVTTGIVSVCTSIVGSTGLPKLDFSSIAEMQAYTGMYDGQSKYLSAGGRSGQFIWTLGDFSAEVAVDSSQGVYVESDSVAATVGVWKLKFDTLWLEYFGCVGDDSTVNTSGIQSALNTAKMLGIGEVYHGAGTFVTGQVEFPDENMVIIGVGRPLNQQQSGQSGFRAASKGLDLFVLESGASVSANVGFKNTNLRGFDDTDTEANLFYNDGSTIVYGLVIDNVGFSDCAWGWFIPNSFADKVRHSHGWNCHTGIGFCSDAVSTVFENPRIGKCPAGTNYTITSITQANPAVVTAAGHDLLNGHIVWLQDVVGMTDVNDRPFVVSGVSGDTFELQGVDSTGYSAYTSGGSCNRTSVGYWMRSEFGLVLGSDTAAETSGRGSFCFVVGESPEFNLTTPGAFLTAHVHFNTTHMEGTDGGFLFVASGSNATGKDCHFITSATPLPRAVYFEYLNDISRWDNCLFASKSGGSYTWDFEVDARDGAKSKLLITPYSIDRIPTVSSGGNNLVSYDVGNYGFRSRVGSAIPIASATETKLVFSSELFDTNSINNTSTGDMTVSVDGIYSISGSVFFDTTVDGAVFEARIKVNGTEADRFRVIGADIDGATVSVSCSAIGLSAGDVVTVHAFQNSGGSIDVASGFKSTIGLIKV